MQKSVSYSSANRPIYMYTPLTYCPSYGNTEKRKLYKSIYENIIEDTGISKMIPISFLRKKNGVKQM